jgi:hypothetical protein
MAPPAEPPESLWPLHGQRGGHTACRGARPTPGHHRRATAPQGLALRAALSKSGREAPPAAPRKRVGDRTGTGPPWRAPSVARSRYP